MKLMHYIEYKGNDLKILANVIPVTEGNACVDFDVEDVSIIGKKEFVISPYSRMYRDICSLLKEDDYFTQVIEQRVLEYESDDLINNTLIQAMEAQW